MACSVQQQEDDGSSPGRQVDRDGLTTMSCTSSEDSQTTRKLTHWSSVDQGWVRETGRADSWDSDAELGPVHITLAGV